MVFKRSGVAGTEVHRLSRSRVHIQGRTTQRAREFAGEKPGRRDGSDQASDDQED